MNTTHHILSWKRCVDDCFFNVRNDEINDLLTYINSINEYIQLTIEKEDEGKFPFLDTTIIKNDSGSLIFKV